MGVHREGVWNALYWIEQYVQRKRNIYRVKSNMYRMDENIISDPVRDFVVRSFQVAVSNNNTTGNGLSIKSTDSTSSQVVRACMTADIGYTAITSSLLSLLQDHF